MLVIRLQTRGNKDQLNVIFNVLGTPSEEEIEALESEEAKQYIRTFAPKEAHDLAERFSASSRGFFVIAIEALRLF